MNRSDQPAKWFRMYAEFANDPKVQRMTETDQRRYIMLLCLRCSNGDVTLHDDDVTFSLRISDAEWAATKAVLLEKNLISADNKPTSWDKRQKHSDSSAERVARHRANLKRSSNNGVTDDVTLQKRSRVREENKEKNTKKENPNPEPPPGLDLKVWETWFDYRQQIHKPIKQVSLLAAQRELAGFGCDQRAVVEQSIANGYQGLFALKARPGKPPDNSSIFEGALCG